MGIDTELIKSILEFSKKLNVLYAEDDEALIRATLPIFEQWFEDVTCCKDGQEAFDIFKSTQKNSTLLLQI